MPDWKWGATYMSTGSLTRPARRGRGGGVPYGIIPSPSQGTYIVWDAAVSPEINCIYSNSSIYIQKAGRYFVGISCLSSSGTYSFELHITQNDVTRQIMNHTFTSTYKQISGQVILDLNVGDYVGVYQNVGAIHGNLHHNSFCGYLIG